MPKFAYLDQETVNAREAAWANYAGYPVPMRHGFALHLRPRCDYSRRRFVYRITESVEMDLLLSLLEAKGVPDDLVALDVGANVGYWAKFLSRVVAARSVFAFEPDPVTFKILARNVEDDVSVKAFELALGAADSHVHLVTDPSDSGDAQCSPRPSESSLEVPCMRLDTFVNRHDISGIDFIKCDIQGAELDFLLGAGSTIASRRPIILIEVMADLYRPFTRYLANFVRETGYTITAVVDECVASWEADELESFSGRCNIFLVPR